MAPGEQPLVVCANIESRRDFHSEDRCNSGALDSEQLF
jgi:hypothetical protein